MEGWQRLCVIKVVLILCSSALPWEAMIEGAKADKKLYAVLDFDGKEILATDLTIGPDDVVLEEGGKIMSEDGSKLTHERKRLVEDFMTDVVNGEKLKSEDEVKMVNAKSKDDGKLESGDEATGRKKRRLMFLGPPLTTCEQVAKDSSSPGVAIEVKKKGMNRFLPASSSSTRNGQKTETLEGVLQKNDLKKVAQLLAVTEALSRLRQTIRPKWWDWKKDDEAVLKRSSSSSSSSSSENGNGNGRWVDKHNGRMLPEWANGLNKDDGFPVYLLKSTNIAKINLHSKIKNGTSNELVVPFVRARLRILQGVRDPTPAELVRREVEIINSDLFTTHVELMWDPNVEAIRVNRRFIDFHIMVEEGHRKWNTKSEERVYDLADNAGQIQKMINYAMGVKTHGTSGG